MSRTVLQVVIDARPRGPRGLIASESVLGRPVIEHLLEMAESVAAGPVAIHAREEEHQRLTALLAARPSSRFRLALGPPPESAAVLRSDRFYDPSRLRRALRRGVDPETAVIWRIDRPHSLESAGDEVIRRRSYQPIGRFWATRPATMLARKLVSTPIRPNLVTLASASLMLVSAGIIGFANGNSLSRIAPALMMALSLVLDTADGHLARLQGTASEFGSWLDSTLDEVSDMALHGAIAWAAYCRSGHVGWLMLGMIYGMAKYLFVVGCQTKVPSSISDRTAVQHPSSGLRSLARALGHADFRWHLWIVLALLGRLEVALIVYAAYFLARFVGGAIRRAVLHAA